MTDDKKGYAIDMGPGQTYYFRIGLEAGIWKGQGKITLDDADRAIKEIRKIKFDGKDKMWWLIFRCSNTGDCRLLNANC